MSQIRKLQTNPKVKETSDMSTAIKMIRPARGVTLKYEDGTILSHEKLPSEERDIAPDSARSSKDENWKGMSLKAYMHNFNLMRSNTRRLEPAEGDVKEKRNQTVSPSRLSSISNMEKTSAFKE